MNLVPGSAGPEKARDAARLLSLLVSLVLLGWLCGCTPEGPAPLEGAGSRESWEALFKKGQEAYRDGNLDAASDLLRAALKEANTFGITDPRRLQTLSMLGTVLVQMERYDEALPLYRDSLRALEDELGADDMALCSVLMTLAHVNLLAGDPKSAEGDYLRVMEIVIKEEGNKSENLAAPLMGLATALREQGKEKEATELENRASALAGE